VVKVTFDPLYPKQHILETAGQACLVKIDALSACGHLICVTSKGSFAVSLELLLKRPTGSLNRLRKKAGSIPLAVYVEWR